MTLAVFSGTPRFVSPCRVGTPIVEEDTRQRFHSLLDGACMATDPGNSPLVQELEERVAERHGVRHAVTATNAALAQMLLFKALGLEAGEVLISANTFVSTAHVCSWQGLKPVFCDIDPQNMNLDPTEIERKFTSETVAVIAGHAFGVFADMQTIGRICREKRLMLLGDATQAFDCDKAGVSVGGNNVPEFMSFHTTEFFSTLEGGAVLTNDGALAREMRSLRNFGCHGSGLSERVGINAGLSSLHAAFGLAALPALEQRRELLHDVHEVYRSGLESLPGVTVRNLDATGRNTYRYCALRLDENFPAPRDAVLEALRRENCAAHTAFAPGCHLTTVYREMGEDAVPLAERELARMLCLPTGFAEPDSREGARTVVDILHGIHENAATLCDWWRKEGCRNTAGHTV